MLLIVTGASHLLFSGVVRLSFGLRPKFLKIAGGKNYSSFNTLVSFSADSLCLYSLHVVFFSLYVGAQCRSHRGLRLQLTTAIVSMMNMISTCVHVCSSDTISICAGGI